MALKITTADERIEVKTLCLTIYAQPGLGKTSLAFTASRPLLFDFDKGSYRAIDRKDVVQVESWADVALIRAGDLEGYDTIVIDTVGKALDALSADIIANNSRLSYGGALNQQGWGQLGVRFSAFLKLLRGFGKDVVLLSHMDEKMDGDAIKERLKIQGGSKDLVLTDSDVIARISVFNKERHLMFSPTETAFGKDPAGLVQMSIPDVSTQGFKTCLADIVTRIKADLNALSEEQIRQKAEAEWFAAALAEIDTADGINAVLDRAKKAGKAISKQVVERAGALGFDFDARARKYVAPGQQDSHQSDPVSQGAGAC